MLTHEAINDEREALIMDSHVEDTTPRPSSESSAPHFATLDALAQPLSVLPPRARVERADEPVAREHLPKLAGEFVGRRLRRVRQLPFEEVDVAVPKPGRDRQPRTVENLCRLRHLHITPAAHGGHLPAVY